jgi:hypothetical protein
MAKLRTVIPEEVASEILYAHARTCCVCNEPGRPIQIHHIDDDPSDHDPENLCVLCLLCHEETQVRGGFGRKLTPSLVRKHRDEWIKRMSQRRAAADRIASQDLWSSDGKWERPPSMPLLAYVKTLPTLFRRATEDIYVQFPGDTNLEIKYRAYSAIDLFEQILIHLSSWFPPSHFGGISAKDYFAKYVSERYTFHAMREEPDGDGGAEGRIYIAYCVFEDMAAAVSDLVTALFGTPAPGDLDLSRWQVEWQAAKIALRGDW